MIHLITSREDQYDVKELLQNDIVISSASDFRSFIQAQKSIQLDTETNVVDRLFHRELYVVQIGDYSGEEQWIFDITGLSGLKLKYLKDCLSDKTLQKVIHNAMFEYSIIQKTWGIDIDKIRDTMLMSRILKTGLNMPKGYHGLAGCIRRYFNIDVDKEAQTSFTSDPMSIQQILYAATDVTLMGKLHDALQVEIDHWQLENTVKLECSVVRPFADGLWNNLYLNREQWQTLMDEKKIQIEESEKELFSILQNEFLKQAEDIGFIQAQDTYLFSWGSSKMKRELMRLVYPMMPEDCTTLPAYKKFQAYLKANEEEVNTEVLDLYLKRNFEGLERYFIQNHQQYLADNNLFIPKGRININFNSPDQVLQLFQLIEPTLVEVGKDTINKLQHPLAKAYRNYKKLTKLYQSYGQNFLDVCDEDGMFRIQSINQLASTGRR
jgi:DNA polymerase I-like protein with 3'-5' exonuclease and polymerase domains